MRPAWNVALALAVSSAAGVAGACVVAEEVSTATGASVVDNGQNLNGQNLNGQNLNGQNLNGQNLNGPPLGSAVKWVEATGARLGIVPLTDVWIDGAELVAHDGVRVRRGAELVGARFDARSDTNKKLELRIAAAEAPGAHAEAAEAWRYVVEYREHDGRWWPICMVDDEAFGAFALDGYWDHRQGVQKGGDKVDDPARFTFACPRIGAIGKCVELGYRPWATVGDGTALDAHHQACVRLLRADFCGDGRSHTEDGALINLYDALGIQDDEADWPIEAEWDADGARCVTPHARGFGPFSCHRRLITPSCGAAPFATGALLVSEAPP